MMKKGFTLAEVLITLTVIGIVAAISLPALVENINDKTWDAKRKALHSRIAAAISQLEDVTRYGQFVINPESGDVQTDTLAESFIVEGLSKVYKVKNVCNYANFDQCGLPKSFTTLSGTSFDFPKRVRDLIPAADSFKDVKNTNAAAFSTYNGEKMAVFYNPDCGQSNIKSSRTIKDSLCINFIYDLNGDSEPNVVGKDIGFISVVYDTAQEPDVVAPMPYKLGAADTNPMNVLTSCKNLQNSLSVPSINELVSTIFNYKLLGYVNVDKIYISGTFYSIGSAGYTWSTQKGNINLQSNKDSGSVICVKE